MEIPIGMARFAFVTFNARSKFAQSMTRFCRKGKTTKVLDPNSDWNAAPLLRRRLTSLGFCCAALIFDGDKSPDYNS